MSKKLKPGAVPNGAHWYVVKNGSVVAREEYLDMAILSCLGFEASGITDHLEGYHRLGPLAPGFITREECQDTYDYWNENKEE